MSRFLRATLFLLFGIVLGTGGPVAAQSITVRNGAKVTVDNGAALNLQGGTMDLEGTGATARLSEQNNGRVANGTLTATRSLNAPSAVNVAGLGAELTTDADLGDVTVVRKHTVQTSPSGGESIARYYDLSVTGTNSGLDATFTHHYADAELNGRSGSDLKLFASADGGDTWSTEGADSRDTGTNTVTANGIDSFGGERWTLGTGLVQTTIYVDESATGANDGTSWDDAYVHLQDALDQANNNPSQSFEIRVATGVYRPDEDKDGDHADDDVTESFTIAEDNVQVFGGYPSGGGTRDPTAQPTVLSGDIDENDETNADGITTSPGDIAGDNSNNVLYLEGGGTSITSTTIIDGVLVTGGYASGAAFSEKRGAGLFCNGRFDGNECSPTIRGVTFIGNKADDGSGSGDGAAIFNNGNDGASSPTIANAAFVNNESVGNGGAIYNNGADGTSSPEIINAVFAGNTAVNDSGGALFNAADGGVGGTSSPTIVNATFIGNAAGTSGGAIYNDEANDGIASPTVQNSILWDNEPGDINQGNGVTIEYTMIEEGCSATCTAIVAGPPRFEYPPRPAGDDGVFGTDDDGLHVTPSSPAINAGDDAALPSDVGEDITGADRIQDGAVDIGAYEGERDQARTIYVDASATGANDGTSWTDADTRLQDPSSIASGALDYATGNDDVWIAEGVYTPAGESMSFTITGVQDGLELYGGFEGTESRRSDREPKTHRTILSGDVSGDDTDPDNDGIVEDADPDQDTAPENLNGGENAHHVVLLDGGNGIGSDVSPNITSSTVLDGLVVTAGQADGSSATDTHGGGLYCDGEGSGHECSPTLHGVVFSGNAANLGGAIYNNGTSSGTSSPSITNVILTGNAAVNRAGAIYNGATSGTSSPRITNATFTNNAASKGGAIYNAGQSGGTASPSMTNATLTDNAASDGGAMYNDGSTAEPEIANTILWDNAAGTSGDEIYNLAANPTLTHTIIEGGLSDISENNSSSTTDGGGNFDRNPQLNGGSPAGSDGRLATRDDRLSLAPGSPALDAGTNIPFQAGGVAEDITTDITGASRRQDLDADSTDTVNVGAYESVEPRSPALSRGTFASATGAYAGYELNPAGSQTTLHVRLAPASSPDQDTLIIDQTLSGAVQQARSVTLRNLKVGTTYEVTAEAGNAVGTFVQGPTEFTIPSAPNLTVDDGAQTVSVHLTGGGLGQSVPDTSQLSVRRGGGDSYQDLPLESTDTGTFEATIPDSLVTARGVDYYALFATESDRLTLPGGQEAAARQKPLHLPVSFEELSPPDSVPFAPKRYRMMSVPASASNKNALGEQFGEYDPVQWRVLQWAPSTGAYQEFPNLGNDAFAPGRAFWLISKGGTRPRFSGGTTVDASTPKTISLATGWNQIGNPFGFAVPWDTVRAASGLSAGMIDGPFRYRDGEYQESGTVRPWEGYFVFNATSETQTLTIPPVGASVSSSTQSTALAKAAMSTKERDPYTVKVTARTEDEAQSVWMGFRDQAKTGRDRLDVAQPPSVTSSVRLSVLESVGERTVPHTASFKPSEGRGATWRLTMSGPSGSAASVRLDLRDEGPQPDGMQRYVLDLKSKRRVAPGAELTLAAGETRDLKVIVGSEAYAKRKNEGIALDGYEDALRGNYPNPFEKATTLEYTLSEEKPVTLAVFDVLGRRIRTLVDDKKRAGLHQVQWDGKNRYGTPVGSGVYFVRMQAGQTRQTKKVVRVR